MLELQEGQHLHIAGTNMFWRKELIRVCSRIRKNSLRSFPTSNWLGLNKNKNKDGSNAQKHDKTDEQWNNNDTVTQVWLGFVQKHWKNLIATAENLKPFLFDQTFSLEISCVCRC